MMAGESSDSCLERGRELEAVVGRVLAECGYDVEVQQNAKFARVDVDIDVWTDDHSSPPNVIAMDCSAACDEFPKWAESPCA